MLFGDWLCYMLYFFFFKQKTAYEMRISDWSSDVCSSDLRVAEGYGPNAAAMRRLAAEGARLLVTVDCGTTAHEPLAAAAEAGLDVEIGRASCRERVCQYV